MKKIKEIDLPSLLQIQETYTDKEYGEKRKSITSILLAVALLLMTFPIITMAQAVSGVTGIVTDANGAVIPGVNVTLTDTKTSKELTTKTKDDGVYVFQNIPPGNGYTLTFSIQNFQTYEVSDVSLGVAKTETRNATLTAGSVGAKVEVVAAPGDTLNTTDASLGNVIDTRQLRDLPIQIRSSPAALIGLQPGVVGNNLGTGATNRVGSVTGSRADQGNITVDGIDANDQATGQAFATVGNAPIDAIQEFRAVTTNPNSSEGRSAGGQIQIVTKSGTNRYHGSLREYNRTTEFSANSFFNNRAGVKRPSLIRNQFGGNLGGPLPFLNFGEGGPSYINGKNRLFFFFDYEGRRDASQISYSRIVPLNHLRNGGLGFINNTAGCATNSRLNTTPQCITILTPAQVAALDPRGVGADQSLLSFVNSRYPQANDLTLGDGINTGGFRFNSPVARNENTYTTRIDANITDKQKVFGRLNIARRMQTDTGNSVAQQFPGDPISAFIQVQDYSLALGYNWVISNSFYNQFTVGVSHSGLAFPRPFQPAFPNIFTLGGGLDAPFAGISEQTRQVDTPTIRDDASYTVGTHTLQFGFQVKPIRSQSSLTNDFNFVSVGLGGNTNALNADLRPASLRTGTTASRNFDSAFALLLGRVGSVATNFNYSPTGRAFAPGTGKSRDFRYNEYEYYVQDNWRLRSDLTVNLGLRYQYYQPPYEANGFQASNDVDLQQLLDIRVRNGAAGIGGDAAEPFLSYSLIGKGNNGRPYYQPDKNNFAPRVQFAYSPSVSDGFLHTLLGDRKTSFRGGYTLVYDRVGGAVTFIADQVSYLFDNSSSTSFGGGNAGTALLNDPRFSSINSIPVQNTPPVITNPFTPFVSNGSPIGNATGETNYTIAQNFEVPYSHQYSFDIQRELPGNFLLDVAYVGRQGRKLFTQADAAQIIDFKDPASGQTLLGAFNAIQSGSTATQPFLENQGALALGVPCASINFQALGFPASVNNCTTYTAFNYGSLLAIGDASDTVQALFSDGILRANVGLSGQFSTNAYITNLGSSDYNGFLLSLQKRFSQGYQFDFNYTFSHSTDNNSSVANTVFGGLICDVRDTNVCQGPSDFDIRHLINVNGIFELPVGRGKYFGRNMNGFLDAVFGGFSLSGIYTYRSGLPFSTTTGSFPVGFVFNSPGVLTGDSSALSGQINDSGSTIQFFGDRDAALAAFRNPQNGTIGQRNNLRGPSFWNLDLGLQKNFRLPWEGHRLQLRADAFNVFNKNFFNLPNANINSSAFGQITTSASSPRELQFAIRYDF